MHSKLDAQYDGVDVDVGAMKNGSAVVVLFDSSDALSIVPIITIFYHIRFEGPAGKLAISLPCGLRPPNTMMTKQIDEAWITKCSTKTTNAHSWVTFEAIDDMFTCAERCSKPAGSRSAFSMHVGDATCEQFARFGEEAKRFRAAMQ